MKILLNVISILIVIETALAAKHLCIDSYLCVETTSITSFQESFEYAIINATNDACSEVVSYDYQNDNYIVLISRFNQRCGDTMNVDVVVDKFIASGVTSFLFTPDIPLNLTKTFNISISTVSDVTAKFILNEHVPVNHRYSRIGDNVISEIDLKQGSTSRPSKRPTQTRTSYKSSGTSISVESSIVITYLFILLTL